jgi:hypothetical protein
VASFCVMPQLAPSSSISLIVSLWAASRTAWNSAGVHGRTSRGIRRNLRPRFVTHDGRGMTFRSASHRTHSLTAPLTSLV